MTNIERAALRKLVGDSDTPAWAGAVLSRISDSELVVERCTIEQSYLDFLREQIELEPRGPDWAGVLSARLGALRQVVGQPLLRIAVEQEGDYFVGHVRVADLRVVHSEVLGRG